MATERTEIERWILTNLSPEPSTTAELMYERMESQSGRCLPVIYEPIDHTERSHWHDEALVAAFSHAMGQASTILDVGPGDGWPSLRMARRFKRIVGIDPSPRRVRVQRENAERLGIKNVEYLQMDVTDMDLEDETFDGVTAASSIEQCEDPEAALREVFRVLRPWGRLAMVFEDYGCYFPDAEGDETLRSECSDEETVLFYQCRRKLPPRETWYALFFDHGRLTSEGELAEQVKRLEGAVSGDLGAAAASEALGLLGSLAPYVAVTKRFELSHFTSESIDRLLTGIGFEDIRHMDHRLPELLNFFDVAKSAGKLDDGGPVFEIVAEVFGVSAVERAGKGPGDFIIATKPMAA